MRSKSKYKLKRKFKTEGGEENWLISYADLMTLLWGFFVILSAFSVPNPSMLEQLKKSTAESMGGKYEVPFNELTDKLKEILIEAGLETSTTLESTQEGIKLSVSSQYFFNSGSAELNIEARTILLKLGKVIQSNKDEVVVFVEGHTDDLPINNKLFASNWELSSIRASTVVRLFESIGISKTDLRPIGLSNIRPVISIEKLSGLELENARALNRRIVIRLQRKINSRTSQVGND